ncbi:MAG: lipoyl synthase [Candidatus Bipolaricaulia bacterium]
MKRQSVSVKTNRKLTERKPEWLKVRPPSGQNFHHIKRALWTYNLHTVCEEAHCPNIGECWSGGTATLMLMGDTCTRGCRFCAVKTGNPRSHLDPLEPMKVAKTVRDWGLRYVVLTSVDRDDLPDGGSGHFATTVRMIKREHPDVLIEVLIPDFQGDVDALGKIVAAEPQVIAHNVETVERLTLQVRDVRAKYRQSLAVLEHMKRLNPEIYTKSSLMVGLGETEAEVRQTMHDLREVDVDILTVGQYLRPSQRHIEVTEYVPPEQFDRYRRMGEELGFLYVASGPFVRSSYRAGEFFIERIIRGEDRNGKAHPSQG